ncbi:unnamed protein product [Allacma fusca]|uniref:Ionotropic glutamate receptor C-terminal domain-containing protein n=1 Tax=Allacma fusca TaxID=39272 RepID=A0A8J2K8E7_9HEXA|nr:unnamed protein product [Allacma fusca]
MHKSLLLILAAAIGFIQSQLHLLSMDVSRKYDVIVLGENTTKIFEQESTGVYSTITQFSSIESSSDLSELQNVIVLIPTTDLDDVFTNLLQVRNGPLHWIYLLQRERHLNSRDLRLLRKFAETSLGRHLEINSLIFIIPTIPSQLPETTHAVELYAIKDKILIDRFPLNLPLQTADLGNIFTRRQNFWNESIRAVAQPLEALIPGQLSTEFSGSKFKFVGGFDFFMLDFVAEALNFSIVPVPGYGWVKKSPNGSLTGMAQQILNDEGDISIISQKMLTERKEHLTFLFPTGEYGVNAFLLRKSNNRLKDILFRSFHLSIWLAIVSAWLVLAFSMWIIKVLKRKWASLTNNDDEIGGHSFVWAAGTARTIGWHVRPDSFPMRMIFICGHFMALVIYNAYSAAFTSILSTDSTLIQTPGDITKYQYKILLDDVTRILDVVVERLEGKPIDAKGLVSRQVPFAEAVPRLYGRQTAFISDPDVFYPNLKKYLQSATNLSCSEIDAKICKDIVQLRVASTTFKSAWFVKKNSPFTPFLNQKLVLMNERGLRYRYRSIYSRENSVRCPQRKRSIEASEPMILTDIWTVYIILFMGTVVSLVILTAEKMIFKFVSKHITF